MKVCHLTSVHPNNDVRIFSKECCALQHAGLDVTLIAPGKSEIIDGVKIIGVKKESSRLIRMFRTVNEVMHKAIEMNANVYHFHDPELIRVGLKLKQLGKKVIYDVHEDVPRQILSKHYLPSFIRKIISRRFEKYEMHAAKKFDAIITVTPTITKRFSVVNKNVVEVCNFPDHSAFNTGIAPWSERKNEVVYIGGIFRIRGIEEMIHAVEDTEIKLHLAGKFSPPSLRDEMLQMNGWQNVIEHGHVERDEVKNILAQSKIGLVLLHNTENYRDAYPVKLFEYMAAGLPVIASKFPLWQEIVEENNCGICVNPNDVNAIRETIKYLLSYDQKAEQMGMNGRKVVEEKYNWQQEEKKLLALYHELLNG